MFLIFTTGRHRGPGRYPGGRPQYGYRVADAGASSNRAQAAWGRRTRRLEPGPRPRRPWHGHPRSGLPAQHCPDHRGLNDALRPRASRPGRGRRPCAAEPVRGLGFRRDVARAGSRRASAIGHSRTAGILRPGPVARSSRAGRGPRRHLRTACVPRRSFWGPGRGLASSGMSTPGRGWRPGASGWADGSARSGPG